MKYKYLLLCSSSQQIIWEKLKTENYNNGKIAAV